jgi:hypothetical protein
LPCLRAGGGKSEEPPDSQLQNLRRNPPVVMVQNAGQVNVGQQQVNAVPMRLNEK